MWLIVEHIAFGEALIMFGYINRSSDIRLFCFRCTCTRLSWRCLCLRRFDNWNQFAFVILLHTLEFLLGWLFVVHALFVTYQMSFMLERLNIYLVLIFHYQHIYASFFYLNTNVAHKRTLLRMRLRMLTQRSLVAKPFLTEIAFERFHFDVRLITVVLQGLARKILGAAFFTDKSLLYLSVQTHVSFEVRL